MYERHFGLACRPFALTPDPDFIFWTDQHTHAKNLLEMTVRRQAPIALVTGEIGSGKTTLIQSFIRSISPRFEVGLLSNVVGDRGDLLRWTLSAFDQELGETSPSESLRRLERFLSGVAAEGRRSVLIVDEAQNVSDHGIETLRLLTNLNAGKSSLLTLVMSGQPQLRDRLRRAEFKSFTQRLGAAIHLGPMSADETLGYIKKRLELAGGAPDLFDAAAAGEVHRLAQGVPRMVNVLCDLCLVSAFGEGRERISGAYAADLLAEMISLGMVAGVPKSAIDLAQAEPMRAAASETPATVSVAQRWSPPLVRLAETCGQDRRPPHSAEPISISAPSLQPAGREQSDLRLVHSVPSGDRSMDAPSEAQTLEHAMPQVTRGRRTWVKRTVAAGGILAACAVGVAILSPRAGIDDLVTRELGFDLAAPVQIPEMSSGQSGAIAAAAQAAGAPGSEALTLPASEPAAFAELAAVDPIAAETLFLDALEIATERPEDAALLYARAAARGHARASYYLGQMYEAGDGVSRNVALAEAWYRAADGVPGAQLRLDALPERAVENTAPPTPLFASSSDGAVELVWSGGAPGFVVEIANDPSQGPSLAHESDVAAVRLEAGPDAGWWRVTSASGETSGWNPIQDASETVVAVSQ